MKQRLSLVGLIVVLVAGLLAQTALAAVNYVTITGPDMATLDCTPGNAARFTRDLNFLGTEYLTYTVQNQRNGNFGTITWANAGGTIVVPTATSIGVADQWAQIPAGTVAGDVLVHKAVLSSAPSGGGTVFSTSTKSWVCDTGLAPITAATTTTTGGACYMADGRLNSGDCAGPVAVYCNADADDPDHKVTRLDVWDIDPETGGGEFSFNFKDWATGDPPFFNTLLAEDTVRNIQLYRLTTGEYQINARPEEDGKVFAFVFNGCPYDGVSHHANMDPNDEYPVWY